MQGEEEPDDQYAWYLTWLAHPQRSVSAVAHWHQVPRRDVLRAKTRWQWDKRRVLDIDAPVPEQVHPEDVPGWLRAPGWSDKRWSWFRTWFTMPSHDLDSTAALHDVPVWVIRQAYRVDRWQDRLDAWLRERASQTEQLISSLEREIKETLMRAGAELAPKAAAWVRRAGDGKDPARGVEAFAMLLRLAREITIRAPGAAVPEVDVSLPDFVLRERGRTAGRIQAVENGLLGAALAGDVEAAKTFALLSRSRSALLGLDAPAVTKAQAVAESQEAAEAAALLEEYVQRTAREMADRMLEQQRAQLAIETVPVSGEASPDTGQRG